MIECFFFPLVRAVEVEIEGGGAREEGRGREGESVSFSVFG